MEVKVLQIGDIIVNHGEIGFGSLGYVELPDSTKVKIPVIVVNGAEEGPTIYIQAVAHGGEMVGTEVIRRVIWEKIDPKTFKGVLITVPVANPLALHFGTRNTPQDELDLSRVFPGKLNGSITERIAHILWSEAINKSDYIIDLHGNNPPCKAHTHLQYTGIERVDDEAENIAESFGLTIVYKYKGQESYRYGSATQRAMEEGIPAITPELIDSRRIRKESVDLGVRGVLNVLKILGMMEGKVVKQPSEFVWGSGRVEDGITLKSSHGGIIARIYNPYGEELEAIKMPFDGYIRTYTLGVHQVLNTGDSVAYITKTK